MSGDIDSLYDKAFYDENLATQGEFAALGDVVHSLLGGPCTVFDVGCGCGLVIARLQELGHDVFGIDGSSHAIAAAPKEIETRIAQRDLRVGARPSVEADVVICLEVAEHLDAEYADRLVEIVTGSAKRMIVWSAAHVGQGGTDHVNEQPPEYWFERFAVKGWKSDEVTSKALRTLMIANGAKHKDYCTNFGIFRKAAT